MKIKPPEHTLKGKHKEKKQLTEVCGPGGIVLRVHPQGLLPPVLLTWTPALQDAGDGPVRQTERREREGAKRGSSSGGGGAEREVVMDGRCRHEELCRHG